MSLTVIVPSKGRPANAKRLAEAFAGTHASGGTKLVFALDHDDPFVPEYLKQVPLFPGVKLTTVATEPQRMGPVLNHVAVDLAAKADFIGFMGDDHLPRTDDWDEALTGSLGGAPGVAYGNDLHQRKSLPTACIVSADIIRTLGYMAPPGLMHLYLDDYWKMLGQAVGNLVYRCDVVIEHLHPAADKAQWDESYATTNSADQYSTDHAAYADYLATWPDEYDKLRRELSLG